MSSMASDYGPSRARLVSHMSVDQLNVGSVGSPRTPESLHHRSRSPVGNVVLSIAWSSETVRSFTWASSEPSPVGDPMVSEDFRSVAVCHDWTNWNNWHHTKWNIDALVSKPFSEHLCLRWCPFMRVIIHVRGADLWFYNWQLIPCREPNQRARCYVAMWHDKKFVPALRGVCVRESR